MIDMATKQFIPAVMRYTGDLAAIVASLKSVGAPSSVQEKILFQCSRLLQKANDALDVLRVLEEQASVKPEGKEKAVFYYEQVTPAMKSLRDPIDELEMIVDKNAWPMPSYGDLLFEV